MMGQQGGWPLTMFLTPDARPFWGGTYFPPSPRWGRPGFPEVLQAVARTYRDDPEKIDRNVDALGAALENFSKPDEANWAGIQSADQIDGIAEAAVRIVDPLSGGTRGAPKFPQPAFFNMLWRAWRRTGRDEFRRAVTVTLDNMCPGRHLRSPGRRLRPLLDGRGVAGPPLREDALRQRPAAGAAGLRLGRHGLGVVPGPRPGDGGLADARDCCSIAAPSPAPSTRTAKGARGRSTSGAKTKSTPCSGTGAEEFKQAYDVAPGGNWEGSTILNRLHDQALPEPETEARWRAMRETLWAARETRERPGLDDKVLADWNGLMITGLAVAGGVFEEPDWIEAAKRAFRFVAAEMGRLTAGSAIRGGAGPPSRKTCSTTTRKMARAALALHQSTGEDAYLGRAETWTATANRHYWDEAGGGYFFSPGDATDLIVRTRTAFDNATPAGNGTMNEVLARLYHLTGEEDHRRPRRRDRPVVHRVVVGTADQHAVGPQRHRDPRPGDPGGGDRRSGGGGDRRARRYGPQGPAEPRPVGRPARRGASPNSSGGGQDPSGRQTAGPGAYVCVGPVCGLPQTSPGDLKAELQRL